MKKIGIVIFLLFAQIAMGKNAPFSHGFYQTPVQEYYRLAKKAYNDKNYQDLLYYSRIILSHFSDTSFAEDNRFYLGVACFHLNQLPMADVHFTHYLKNQQSPNYFDQAIEYKFSIAEKYRTGEKKPLFNMGSMPKLVGAKRDAIRIYDEVVHSVLTGELAAKSLYAKGELLFAVGEGKESVECFEELIQRFPKHPLAIESFLSIGKVLLEETTAKDLNPDSLGLAEVNIKRFEEMFPGEERIAKAKSDLQFMKEKYAKGMFDIGAFFEKTGKPKAAAIYYAKIANLYPDTNVAKMALKRQKNLK